MKVTNFLPKNFLRVLVLIYLSLFLLANCNTITNPDNNSESKRNQNLIALYALGQQTEVSSSEAYSGGDTTVFITNSFSFQSQAANMKDESKQLAFIQGHAVFTTGWVTPGSTANTGLGPTFNATSCTSCHALDGRGQPQEGTIQSSLLFRLSNAENYGDQFNPNSIGGVDNEGTITVSYTEQAGTYPDGETYSLRVPTYTVALANHGSVSNVLVSPRIAAQVPGLGLLEAISEATLLAMADENDADGDGISGRANYVTDVATGTTQIGRFGWKANQPNLNQQNQGAFLGDIGITSPLFSTENCPGTQASGNCGLASSTGKGIGVHEVNQLSIDVMNSYMKTIGVPGRRNWRDATVQQGKALMVSVGCTKCHVAEITTGTLDGFEEVSNQTIRPYSDLLLHDMGDALADGRPDFLATGNEWRTPPLWGLGLVKSVNEHDTMLHDGRARGFAEAILWHGGEAETAKNNFMNLSKTERDALVKFLESL
ncbi:MAG: di-heme oxidoredictase family protein [Spirochaetota bacterium]